VKRLALAAVLVGLAALPLWAGGTFYINIASQILLYAVLALGINVLVGYAGLVTLGHAGLLGIAAYSAARLLTGGEVATGNGLERGNFYRPTIFADVEPGMRIAQEEIFGPVLSVIPVKDPEQALSVANDTIYGLASAIFTSDINKAFKFAKGLRAGSVWVNTYDGGDITTPFGGYKQSGIGRDKSLHAFDKFTQVKTTWIQLG